jgi:hypothetical protein
VKNSVRRWLVSAAAVSAAVFAFTQVTPSSAEAQETKYKRQVKYPKGYRDWTHTKSMVIQQGHPLFEAFGGIHHIYANDKALKALKQGKPFPDGSVFAFDLLESPTAEGAITEGNRKVLGVMEKDSKAFASTGGWGFEAFKGDTQDRAVADPAKDCFSCHEQQASKTGFVFSKYRP